MSDTPLTSEEFRRVLEQHRDEMKQSRHENNTHISEVVGELRLEQETLLRSQEQTSKVVNLLEKNFGELQKGYTELTAITGRLDSMMKFMVEELDKRVNENEKEIGKVKSAFYESDTVQNYKVNLKRIEDLEGSLDKGFESFRKKDETHDEQIATHNKWFFAGFVVLAITQVLLEVYPNFKS